ncbi:MAG: BamA/TamA family outer membrane protein [Planctomycetaceae bacterium]
MKLYSGKTRIRVAMLAGLLATVMVMVGPLTAQEVPETVVDIRIEGNETIPSDSILQKLRIQPGRPLTNRQLREDKRNLFNTQWFYSVSERFEETPQGAVLVFEVHERPIVRRVEFRGIKKLKLKELASWTGLKVGSPFDHRANREAVNRIEQEYKERGFFFAKVTLEKGGDPQDREIIFLINEGPKVRVQERRFEFVGQGQGGNALTDSLTWLVSERKSKDGAVGLSPAPARLRTRLQSKEALFGVFGGLYKPETLEGDVESLKQYYRGLGFFDVKVTATPLFSADRSDVRIKYTIDEGIPYKVRNMILNGNHVIAKEELRKQAKLRSGDYFNSLPLSEDVEFMKEQYGDRGHYFASVVPVPKFTEEPGIVDLVFEIDEDRPRYLRHVNAQLEGDHPHTMQVVPVNQFQMEPGDLANPKLVNRGRSRIAGSGILENVNVEVVPVDPGQTMTASSSRTVRGQNGVGYQASWKELFEGADDSQKPFVKFGHSFPDANLPDITPSTVGRPGHSAVGGHERRQTMQAPVPAVTFVSSPKIPTVVDYAVLRPSNIFHEPQKDLLVSAFPDSMSDTIIRGQSPGGGFYQPPVPQQGDQVLSGSPYNNQFQELPPGWVDVNISAAEGRTGRLMFGAGVNSDAGIVGSFVWDERNFNLFRPPQTFADIIEGRAWRGGGQRFRLEAAPGDQVSRYAISWTDPYFMYSDYSLGLSGFYFNRFYPDWDETRLGGRVTVGKQWTPEWSSNVSLRLEDVEIGSVRNTQASIGLGTPMSVPELEAVKGSNFLSTVGASISYDTRDSSLLPSEGHFITGNFEQAFGDFNYPRLEGEARQYFTMFRRPDGSGRHVLTLAGNLGWSGDDTPVFERYYAGGFQSFRGFAFRGVTPRGEDNISTGGTYQMLGTAEYRIPITADDMINLVAFTDMGTVEQEVRADNFRITVGLGLRVVVPAMGPVPLAFDFGFPVRSNPEDDERIFSFYVGINR